MRNLVWSAFLAALLYLADADVLVGRSGVQELLLASAAVEGSHRGYPAEPLECLEVTSPVLSPRGLVDGNEVLGVPAGGRELPSCEVTLMKHDFGNSYEHPFVANYVPPTETSCPLAQNFNRVILNLTVVSEGRQFDRLATMWLDDIEVWRTSTAEPKPHPGIAWTYWKDMSHYLSLWKKPQKLIFDLGNLINEKYTGYFNATLTATYFRDTSNQPSPLAPPADQILAISAARSVSNSGSAWTYPEEKAAVSVVLPRNIRRAVVTIAATGQADEEFWWTNVPEESTDIFNGTTLLGKGAFREVRLYIDGILAGLSWPFPIVFTGGVSPPLHRPVVGPQAFNLREQEIDMTPWLGILCDGKPHDYALEVVGANEAVVNKFWILSGKIFIWLDGEPGHITTGSAPSISVSKPDYQPHDTSIRDQCVRYDQTAHRKLEIKSTIGTRFGKVKAAWVQTFSMRNEGELLDSGNFQNVTASYMGRDSATSNGATIFDTKYSYPIFTSFKQTAPDGEYSLTLDANLTQTMDLIVTGQSVFPSGLEVFVPFLSGKMSGSSIVTSKKGRAFFWQTNEANKTGGYGKSDQHYVFAAIGQGTKRDLYWRDISVFNETTTHDSQWTYGLDLSATTQAHQPAKVKDDAPDSFAAKLIAGRPAAVLMQAGLESLSGSK